MEQTEKNGEFIVTARKWRPLKFADIVGQSHITVTIQNSLKMNRVHHAYLFSGPRGVGKTTTARILARAVNCTNQKDFEPCNECLSCTSILEGRSLDVIEIDGASNNSVDDVRKLRENSKYPPVNGKYKMYIIDEVHMLSTAAFNALLKTLEEPPPHLLFVFATTESQKVPATILSRCQRHAFRRMEIADIVGRIKFIAENEGIKLDEESTVTIAKKADGSMRDAQSIFDQVVAFCGKEIKYSEMADALHLVDQDFFFRISNAILSKDLNEMFSISNELMIKGFDIQECLNGMLEHFRNLLAVKVTQSTKTVETSAYYIDKYKTDAARFSKNDLLRILVLIANVEQTLKFSSQPRIKFETLLIQLASLDSSLELTELLNEIKEIKKKPELLNYQPNLSSANENVSMAIDVIEKFRTDSISQIKDNSTKKNQKDDESITALPNEDKEFSKPKNVEDGWQDFLNSHAGPGAELSVLAQPSFVTPVFFKDEILFKTPNDFSRENLEKKKQLLVSSLSEYFGNSINVRIVVDSDAFNNPDKGTKSDINQNDLNKADNKDFENKSSNIADYSPKSKSSEKIEDEKHPIEKAIIELFGAKEINL